MADSEDKTSKEIEENKGTSKEATNTEGERYSGGPIPKTPPPKKSKD